ncbi:MAG: hypothetical protein H7281_03970 [Bacteriovorax sp.]|nr:hypothetical protein [Bacteriovorax sp.]
MKYLILFTMLFSHSNSVLAADATTATTTNSTSAETAVNQTLLDNGAAAQKLLEASTANKIPTSIKILSNKGSSSTTTSKTNLTDQDKQLSENYVDQGAANRIIKEKCVGEMAQACAGSEVDHKVMGMSPGLMKAAAQAYASFGAMSDTLLPMSKPAAKVDAPPAAGAPATGISETHEASVAKLSPDTAKKAGAKPDNAKPDDAKEKPVDYCKYIPAATEAISVFSQKNTVEALNNGGETSQKEALLKAAKSHDGRAQQAQIQAVGWYGGAACYAVNAMSGNFATDTSLIVKLGAATLLGTFYQAEVAANKDYAQKTRDIANALPGKGDCNPVTQNDCYCAEPENANNPTYCAAQIAKKAATPSAFTRTACTDSNMKLDPACACEKTNNCFDKYLENQGAAELQIGMGYSNSPFKSIASIAHGKLEGTTMSSQGYAGTAAIAKKALSDFSSKVQGNNNPLTASQKAVADAISSKGIPANIARLMSQNSPPQSAIDKSMAKVGGYGSYQEASYSSGRSNVLDFSGGNGLGIGGNKGDKKGSAADDFLGKLNPKGGSASNSKVLEFAQKAQAQAPQITKSDKPIFEIISIRYQTSGRRLLQLDSNN